MEELQIFFTRKVTFIISSLHSCAATKRKNGKRKAQEVPQSQAAALLRHQEEEETDKTKQGQIEQTYEKH